MMRNGKCLGISYDRHYFSVDVVVNVEGGLLCYATFFFLTVHNSGGNIIMVSIIIVIANTLLIAVTKMVEQTIKTTIDKMRKRSNQAPHKNALTLSEIDPLFIIIMYTSS